MSALKISVIVPVYKVEKYLSRCVDSLLKQSFRDMEIILVDDGSPDACPAICDEYAARDDRIRVIHKENGGISSARNAGIDAARGRYIGFVDSDDYVEPEMFERLYELAEREKAEISVCGFYNVRGTERTPAGPVTEPFACPGAEALEQVLRRTGVSVYVWSRLIRRELFEKGLRFPEGKTYEDVYVAAELFLAVGKVAADLRPMYNYVWRPNSITQSGFHPGTRDVIDAYEHVLAVVSERCPSLVTLADAWVCWAYFFVYDKMRLAKVPAEQARPVKDYLRKNAGKLLRCASFTRSRRLGSLIFMLSPALYERLLLRMKGNG